MFETVLIANRGEIALRVIRTCRAHGVRTIAIHTDVDAGAPHVRAADEAVHVSGYLDIDSIVEAARTSGAEAIHPGYGFLSERAAFVRAVEAAGVVFIGPSADVMDRMGRKDAAREIAVAAGVPVVPRGEDAGYPVLVKAASGGGGKGMRIVRSAGEYDDAVATAKREAQAAFGDDTLLVEKYVERGRHLEVQVMGDQHGTVVHLHERDCSTQRRHQKVLEEAPAPTISDAVRERLTSAAVALTAHVGYVGAGTVEFLLDAGESGTGDDFYFLEMNTRLQVEHPVTEAILGDLDLVHLQLKVAAGLPLGLEQSELTARGHAIEARIYAEDPYAGFLPQAGRASIVRWPGPGSGSGPGDRVRVDHALESGQVVSTSFDPMLGKVIVHGPDRESARRAMVAALDHTAVLGLTTNVGFLRQLVASDAFRDATIDTAWLDRTELARPSEDTARVIAAWTDVAVTRMSDGAPHPFQPDSWRLAAEPASVHVELDRPVEVRWGAGVVDGVVVEPVLEPADHTVVLTLDGVRHRAVVNAAPHEVEVVHRGQRFVFARPDVMAGNALDAGDGAVLAPMPGTVLDVRVAEGETVQADQVLGSMEAMKMEMALKAPFAGTVTAVGCADGDQVALGARLFLVESPEDTA